jgi:shikimate kinase
MAELAAARDPVYARLADLTVDVTGMNAAQVADQCAAGVRSLEAQRAWR